MNTHHIENRVRGARALLALVAAPLLVAGSAGARVAAVQSPDAGSLPAPSTVAATERGGTVQIATAKLIIEYNSTDDDIGIHGEFDDHGWSKLTVYDPTGKPVLSVKPQKQLKSLTMAGIFFESREPPASEFTFEDLKAQFPEGTYEVRGLTFDGQQLVGAAAFTHAVPAPPVVTFPLEDSVVPTAGLSISWNDVTRTIDDRPVTITGYEVIITKENHNDPNGFSRPVFDVHVPADRNTLSVPVEFLEPGTDYELEVLALETSGNQTISVSFFRTE